MSQRIYRILVVDDLPAIPQLLRQMLEPHGYVVLIAHDGESALEQLLLLPPDLLIVDALMPGIDGYEVIEKARAIAELQSMPIVMMTALCSVQDKTRALSVGADDFISKPFDRVEMLARIRSLLRIKALHDELEAKNRLLEQILNRYVSRDIVREILEDPEGQLQLGGRSAVVSVLIADIRGFTHFSEHNQAACVVEILNTVFKGLSPLVFENGGTLDKYMGDAIMAFFGAPRVTPDSVFRAVRTAWQMLEVFEQLQARLPEIRELGLGCAICTGEAIVGNIGNEQVMDYTVIGDPPNTASRLQGQALAGQVLIDQATAEATRDTVRTLALGEMKLKGRTQPLQVFQVLELASPETSADRGSGG